MTKAERRHLSVLASFKSPRVPASAFAQKAWGLRPDSRKQAGLNMRAGSALQKLHDHGFASRFWNGTQFLWSITDAGRKEIGG